MKAPTLATSCGCSESPLHGLAGKWRRRWQAAAPGDMNLPGFGLHPLRGGLAGHWAVRVSGNWRIVFRFDGGDVRDVDLIDYH